MKTGYKFASLPVALFALALVFFAFTALARAGVVVPSVCLELKKETFTRLLTFQAGGSSDIEFDGADLPGGFYTVLMNPGGANEELRWVKHAVSANTLGFGGMGQGNLLYVHQPGETLVISYDGYAVFGYNNTGSTTMAVPRGVNNGGNYFAPGPLVYSTQPTNFLPGVHEDAMRLNVVLDHSVSWWLLGTEAKFDGTAANICGTITYQGRLTDGSGGANGQYDMQFQAYDSDTGGTPQGTTVTIQDVPVSGGIFTVQLRMGTGLNGNFSARYLEIGVRPGNAAPADPYTKLTPRQPITSVPYAINAQYAANAGNASTAVTATNSTQLAGVAASSYLTNTSLLGQNATTVRGIGTMLITAAAATYTLIPGLEQTINVPANSVLYISTDGGIHSLGAIDTVSVVDVAIFVDGTAVSERKIVVNNSGLAGSVANWSLALAQTLSPGSHVVHVRARNSFEGAPSAITSDPVLLPQLTVAVIKK